MSNPPAPLPLRRDNTFDTRFSAEEFTSIKDKIVRTIPFGKQSTIHEVIVEWLPSHQRENVALKVISKEAVASRERKFLTFLAQERIQHDHLTKFYTGYQIGDNTYLVAELTDEGNLVEFTKSVSPEQTNSGLDRAWFLSQLRGLAGALDAIHAPTTHTVYHHDIKLENILIFKQPNGKYRFKFTDWGCAGVEPTTNPQGSTTRGNPPYLPPESRDATATTQPHDLWSLGCVFLELMIWYFEGKDKFNEHLHAFTATGAPENYYYNPTSGPTAHTNLALTALARLKLKEESLVNIIRKMFVIDPTLRLTAAGLVTELAPVQ